MSELDNNHTTFEKLLKEYRELEKSKENLTKALVNETNKDVEKALVKAILNIFDNIENIKDTKLYTQRYIDNIKIE